jgi:cytochrome b
MNTSSNNAATVRVWDFPTRAFHWTLVVLIALQYATGEYGMLDMRWHAWFGYATLALIVFRVLWGFFGSQTSRFSDFVRGPRAALRYVKSQLSTNPQRGIGHNALGGWSVLALLLCVAIQAVSGLFASDDIDSDGPLVAHVSHATVKWMTRVHHWNQNVLLALIGLHVVAVLLYLLLKHENLILPMLSGRKQAAGARPLFFVDSRRALALLIIVAAAVAILLWWAG